MPTSADQVTRGRPVAACAWCGASLATIVELLAHVEDRHLAHDKTAAA